MIGREGFKPFVRNIAFKDVPKILETPKETDEKGRGLGCGEPGSAAVASGLAVGTSFQPVCSVGN